MTAKTSASGHKRGSSRVHQASSGNQQQQQQQQQAQDQQEVQPQQQSVTESVVREARRGANKPLMEKRRRARINQSLAVLKALILDAAKANSDNAKHSKLEKADILELTVRHFQRHRSVDTAGLNKYRAGYSDCVREVQRYLSTPDTQSMCVIEPGVRQRLLRHLENCVAEIDTDISPPATQSQAALAAPLPARRATQLPCFIDNTQPCIVENNKPCFVENNNKLVEVHSEETEEKNLRLEADSSTEEINNNTNNSNSNDTTFRQTPNLDANLREAALREANFRQPDFSPEANFSREATNFREANFQEANCSNFKFPKMEHVCQQVAEVVTARMEPEVGVAPQHIATLPNNVIRMYDGNLVFVLPSHYVQLAAALGVNLSNQVAPAPVAESSSTPEMAKTQVESQTPVEAGAGSAEKPLDYSKNNENDSMWRPW